MPTSWLAISHFGDIISLEASRYHKVPLDWIQMPKKKSPELGAEQALTLVTNQWFVLIVHALMLGKKRYSELSRVIPSVSKKMLTQTLRGMERDGLVKRTVMPVVPPHTEYELTPLGQTLVPPLQELCHWAGKHYGDVESHRRRFDREASKGTQSMQVPKK